MYDDEQVCPSCGRRYAFDAHVERCRASAFTGRDTCPMCGEPYDDYLAHLRTDCSPR